MIISIELDEDELSMLQCMLSCYPAESFLAKAVKKKIMEIRG